MKTVKIIKLLYFSEGNLHELTVCKPSSLLYIPCTHLISSTEQQRSKRYWNPLFTIRSLSKSILLHFTQAINWEDWCETEHTV